jgi:hypothetical protein
MGLIRIYYILMKYLNMSEERIVEIVKDIWLWNLQRDCVFNDNKLDNKLIIEEIDEYGKALKLYNEKKRDSAAVEVLDGLADIIFVIIGIKLRAIFYYKQGNREEVGEKILNTSLSLCPKELLSYVDPVLTAVIRSNNTKPKEKDVNGKIIKGENYIAPTEEIKLLLNIK